MPYERLESTRKLTADVPRHVSLSSPARRQRQLNMLERLTLGVQDVLEQRDVGHRQAQSVDLGQALLVRKRRHVTAKLVERAVDTQHAPALANVRREPLPRHTASGL